MQETRAFGWTPEEIHFSQAGPTCWTVNFNSASAYTESETRVLWLSALMSLGLQRFERSLSFGMWHGLDIFGDFTFGRSDFFFASRPCICLVFDQLGHRRNCLRFRRIVLALVELTSTNRIVLATTPFVLSGPGSAVGITTSAD